MTKTKTTHILAIIDRSGSMAQVHDDVIGGFNEWLKETKKAAKGLDVQFTLHQFDTEHEQVYTNAPITKVAKATVASFAPRGQTALFDAVGMAITSLDARMGVGDSAIVLIITDGHENASREWYGGEIRKLIKKIEADKHWIINFLGANQDAFAAGTRMGMKTSGMVSTQHDSVGTRSGYAAAAHNTNANLAAAAAGSPLRSMTQADYDAEDKKRRAKK